MEVSKRASHRKRLFYAILEVSNRDCVVKKRLARCSHGKFRVLHISKTEKGVEHLVCRDDKRREECRVMVSSGCPVCLTLLSRLHVLSGFSVGSETIYYVVVAESKEDLAEVCAALESRGYPVKLKSVVKFPRPRSLTPRQRMVLLFALANGYFDYPRRVTTEELAAKLGVSPSALNETLRRGIKSLLYYFFSTKTQDIFG